MPACASKQDMFELATLGYAYFISVYPLETWKPILHTTLQKKEWKKDGLDEGEE